jgi:hypothetical protein
MTRPRAFEDLSQLPDEQLFQELTKGLDLVHKTARSYFEAAEVVAGAGKRNAVEALQVFAEEEAAKFMILLDAVRAPRRQLARQLSWCNGHLAKGIYAEYYHTRPADFREVREFVERNRPSLYLDGPNDIDYIMRNWIEDQREQKLYVDYIESEGGHYWHTPAIFEHFHRYGILELPVLRIATALHSAGLTEPAAMEIIAGIWRPVEIVDELHWQDLRRWNLTTLEALNERGLLHDSSEDTIRFLVNEWLYPLYPLEHSRIKVDRKVLIEERESRWWSEP